MLTSVWIVLAFGTLVVTGLMHLVDPTHLATGLRQIAVPAKASLPSAVLVAATEVLIGSAGMAALVVDGFLATAAPLSGFVLYCAFAIYQVVAASRSKDAMCACGRSSLPISKWTIGRALLLAVICLAALETTSLTADAALVLTQYVAGAALAVGIWVLPSAVTPNKTGART